MLAEEAVMPESVDEEAVAFGADAFHPLLIAIAQEGGGHGEIRIHGVAQRLAFVFDDFVVILHPLARLFRTDEGKCERAQSKFGGLDNRFAPRAGHP